MADSNSIRQLHQEGRILLALQALERKTIYGLRNAARTCNVDYYALRRRYNKVALRRDCELNQKKLTRLKEDVVIQHILYLDVRGFSPILAEVGDMANKLLKARGKGLVSINWLSRFVNCLEELKMAFN